MTSNDSLKVLTLIWNTKAALSRAIMVAGAAKAIWKPGVFEKQKTSSSVSSGAMLECRKFSHSAKIARKLCNLPMKHAFSPSKKQAKDVARICF
jgi:hypothetical protein